MPDEKEKQQPENAEAEVAKEEKKSPLMQKLLLVGIILLVVIAEGIVAYFLVQATKSEDPRLLAEKRAKEQEEAARQKLYTIGMTTEPIDVIVNVAGEDDEERYAKIAVQLEFDDTQYPELLTQLEVRKPKIKNIMIEQLTIMQLEDLISPTGKLKLRKAVLREVNKTLPPKLGQIRDVFLSEFILQ